MEFAARIEQWQLKQPFVIARERMTTLPLVHLRISAEGAEGHGEAAGVDYDGETPDSMVRAITAYLQGRSSPPTRREVLADLPAGGTRNAIDCALWDWEAKRERLSAATLAGLGPLKVLRTAYTLSLADPESMARAIKLAPPDAVLKLKLGGGDGRDVDRVAAVRGAAPGRRMIVDVNQGWTLEELNAAAPHLADMGVELIEQPLPAGRDAQLAGYHGTVALCADESFNTFADLDRMAAYQVLNIKLDKCGGLTAALALADAALARGYQLFVGSMLGTSLGMAPAFLVGQRCAYVDLDGPLLLAGDRDHPMQFDGAMLHAPPQELWG
ncbi:dipeptide epimerase [Blastomonas fulva]|jgi:L-alanine-DL-glutamate epimerase-like enolase superfamily enzyme|uniref:dipeptide epimerase n=1 Tax=Blastomonas fulva TaxID=1550728 RepID=UPI003D298A78